MRSVDLHSHLIPGVDDGARTLPEALDGLAKMVHAGVERIVTTPHLDASTTVDPVALEARLHIVDRAWDSLVSAARERFPWLVLERGFEIALDVPDVEAKDDRLRLGGSTAILVEWPRMQVPPGTVRVLESLRAQGYRPVVAHAERYRGMDNRVTMAREWRRAGACLQVNQGSLVGRHGALAKDLSYRLLRHGLVDLLATDYHGRPHIELHLREVRRWLTSVGGGEQAHLLMFENPQRVLGGLDPLPVPPVTPRDWRVWTRVRDFLRRSPR